MPEKNPGADASLFVLNLKDCNPRERLGKIVEGFVSRSRREQSLARKLLVDEARQKKLVAKLTEKELYILSRRFPQKGKRETQKKIGKYMGVSANRVHQLEAKALGKLRKALYGTLLGQTP